MDKYPIQAEIGAETWYIEAHGDSPEHAVDEGRWMIKRIANVPIGQVKNARVEAIED
jgi:hypothetical protein